MLGVRIVASMAVSVRWAGLVLTSALFFSSPSRAQERHDPAAADELFRQGRAASEKRDFLTACAKFRESNRLDPAVGTLFNIADCEEKLGRLATSWTLFQEVAQRLPNDDDRHGIALRRAQAIEPRVPRLTVHLAPSGRSDVIVRRDGVELGAASLDTALPVNPGEHVVVVEAPGTQATQFRSSVGEGERAQLDVKLGPAQVAVTAPDASGSAPGAGQRTAAYVIGGVGVAGLITGIVAGALVLDRKSTVNDNCVEKQCNRAGQDAVESGKTLGVVSTVGFIAGGLGLGTATYLFLSAPSALESSRSGAYMLGIRAKW